MKHSLTSVMLFTCIVSSSAFAGCDNYEDGSLSVPAPRVILCYRGKCDNTQLLFQCSNIHGTVSGYANGLHIDIIDGGVLFSNKYRRMNPKEWTCKPITSDVSSCIGFENR